MGHKDKADNGHEAKPDKASEGQEPPFRFEFLTLRNSLKPYLNSVYLFETSLPKINESMPAVGGQLFLLFEGTTKVVFGSGGGGMATPTFLVTPMNLAAQYEIRGPMKSLGTALTQLGWAAITSLRPDTEHDQLVDAQVVFGNEVEQLRLECATGLEDGSMDYADAAERLQDMLEAAIKPVSERHQKTIALTLEWLNSSVSPRVEDLYPLLPYSQRQAQRLVAQFFGLPPSKLVRRYRAQRAASLLAHAGGSNAAEAELADAFTDQSHMIREVSRYTGKTPKKLGNAKNTAMSGSLDPKGYRPVKSMPGMFGEDDTDDKDKS